MQLAILETSFFWFRPVLGWALYEGLKMDFRKTTTKELVSALTSSASNFYYLHKRNGATVEHVNALNECDLKRFFVASRGLAVKRSNFVQLGESRLYLSKIKVYQYKNLFLVEYEHCFCLYELNYFWKNCEEKASLI